ncbi:MAG: hypothetical protein PHU45_05570 [Bacilli bacterium]|nr:hypothetical protein [Bacilli bacterium]
MNIRKHIVDSISIKEIIKNFNNKAIAENFSLNKKNKMENLKPRKLKIDIDKEFIIYYNPFYPNKIIADLISEQLNKNNIKCSIKQYKYSENIVLKDNEINLVLNYFEFYDELYFYDSQYFKYLMKNSKFYMELIKLYKKYNFRIILNLLNISISKRYVKIPLFSFKSIYYANKELSNFSFLELNYDLIPNESFLNKNKTKK